MPAFGMVYANRGSLLTASEGEPGAPISQEEPSFRTPEPGRQHWPSRSCLLARAPHPARAAPAQQLRPRGRLPAAARGPPGTRARCGLAASPGCRCPGQDKGELEGQPTPDLLPGDSHGRRGLARGVAESRTLLK